MKIDPKQVRFVECRATAAPAHEATDGELSAVRAAFEAGGPPLMTDGKPTVTRMTAWMAHEGVNRNRLAFVKEELELAAQKVTVTSPLVMDFNHSAIHGWEGEQRCIGVWHSAEYAFDAFAKGGEGAWGILVQGVMFAWLFPDVADALQAEQGRKGYIEFSMACIPSSIEFAIDGEGRGYEVAHNPIFFTNSALDVAPADPDAKGLGSESASEGVEATQREQLLQLAASKAQNSEEAMNEEMKALLAQLEATLAAKFETILATDSEAKVAATEAFETKIAELETALVVAQTEIERLTGETVQLEAAVAASEQTIAELRVVTDEYEAAAQEALQAAVLAARLASLPEAVQTAHAARDEAKRTRLESKWIAMSDEDWSVYLEDELGIATASAGTTYLERSNRDIIPASKGPTLSLGERARLHIK